MCTQNYDRGTELVIVLIYNTFQYQSHEFDLSEFPCILRSSIMENWLYFLAIYEPTTYNMTAKLFWKLC